MEENISNQEGQVEGKVNDQVANDQNVGSQEGNSKTERLYTLKGGKLTVGNFKADVVGEGNSQSISGRLRSGKLDDELKKIASNEDLQKLVDKLIAERKNGGDYSQMTEGDLRRMLYQVLAALVGKTNKSIEDVCAEMIKDWKTLEELRKKRSTAAVALAECDQELESFGF
jgi:hypothetical protein